MWFHSPHVRKEVVQTLSDSSNGPHEVTGC
jgi:hypothetical protein